MKLIYLFLSLILIQNCTQLNSIPFLDSIIETDQEKKSKENQRLFLVAGLALSNSRPSVSNLGAGRIATCDGTGGKPKSEKNLVSLTVGGSVYTAGIAQVTSTNQDAFLYKTTNNNLDFCYYYDNSAADTRGDLLVSQDSFLYVAFSTDGGNASFQASTDAMQKSYGTGGGPRVTYLAKMDLSGNILRSTFIGARLDDGKVNTLTPKTLTTSNGNIIFEGNSAYDGGKASDSIDPGNVCASGSTRRIEFNSDLRKISTSCY
ncbi:MAG TPA: hypothetical protein PK079_05020 [Leptospiraceae bacterium]|nr:hypothetical protein [Leptospiraceae bacterium]HMW06232.1 hypothetical protein [Leptospiraceae bacterium]HMX34434.1 hypothetical protein [Leptospiraceae bacterium]HMY31694.1 hypothetical protein [Leptospiraceae bacterium]HMZ65759.1 hypothetical protein [Leptospiraceae bacterium]